MIGESMTPLFYLRFIMDFLKDLTGQLISFKTIRSIKEEMGINPLSLLHN